MFILVVDYKNTQEVAGTTLWTWSSNPDRSVIVIIGYEVGRGRAPIGMSWPII